MGKVNPIRQLCFATVRTRIIGSCGRRLELPLLVWSGVFFIFAFALGGRVLVYFSPLFQRRRKSALYNVSSDYPSFYGVEIRGWARLILGNKDEQQGMGTSSDEPQYWLVGDLACTIWLENSMSSFRVFILTSQLKRSSYQEVCCVPRSGRL